MKKSDELKNISVGIGEQIIHLAGQNSWKKVKESNESCQRTQRNSEKHVGSRLRV